jgi:hypothetical protein
MFAPTRQLGLQALPCCTHEELQLRTLLLPLALPLSLGHEQKQDQQSALSGHQFHLARGQYRHLRLPAVVVAVLLVLVLPVLLLVA